MTEAPTSAQLVYSSDAVWTPDTSRPFVSFAQEQDVCVIVTPDGTKFLDMAPLAGLSGHPVRVHYKRPEEPDVLPPPDTW